MNHIDTMKLALEALEVLGWQPTEEAMDYRDNAITALREALAEQPAPEREDWGPGPHECHNLPAQRKPLTDDEIEKLREKTFSTGNPYCPVDSKSMRKVARAIEAAHGIKENT